MKRTELILQAKQTKAIQEVVSSGLLDCPRFAFTSEHVEYVKRYGGLCRDCADEDGVCPTSGLPCGESDKAIKHVLGAIEYGVNKGFIPPPNM